VSEHPPHKVGLHPASSFVVRRARRMLTNPPSIRTAASVIVSATTAIVVLGALAMRIFDGHDFPTIWRSLWWSVQTATTVGYGDVTPTTVAGRIVGAVVMLQGIAFLAVVTASITSVFVARAQRELTGTDERLDVLSARIEELNRRLGALVDPGSGSPPSHDAPVPAADFNRDDSYQEGSRD
jgi:hypothetical protein